MKKTIAFLMCCVAMPAFAAEVYFSAPQVGLGDSVELIFKSEKAIQTPPDLTPVEQYFVVAGTQQRMNSTFVNGQGSQSYELIYSLFPKSAGTVDLKGLTLNNEALPPVSVQVVAQSAQPVGTGASDTNTPAQALTLTGSVQRNQIYQGESFLYTVRLVENVGVSDGAFQPPAMADARVQPVGQVKTTTQQVDGQSVRVAEQSFLITPEGTGALTIPSAVFNGAVLDKQRRRPRAGMMSEFFENELLFGRLQSTRPVYLQSQPIEVTVEPKPADWSGWWLPSTEVILSEQYNLPDEVRAGTPFERKVVLSARGVDGNGLPLLNMVTSDTLSVYPSPEKRQTQMVNTDLLGVEEITFALVPSASGTITVPAIQIPWFDTESKQRKVATLPEKVITVLPALGQTGQTAVPLTPAPTGDALKTPVPTVTPIPTPAVPVVTSIQTEQVKDEFPLVMIGALFGGGVLAGLLGALGAVWLMRPRPPKRTLGGLEPPEKKRKKKKPLPDLYPF